jgi:hypothetical protein
MRSIIWALATASLLAGGLLALSGMGAGLPGGKAAASELTARDIPVLPPFRGLRVGLDVLVDGQPLPTVRCAGKTYVPVPGWGTE